jgi:hypothetical protein
MTDTRGHRTPSQVGTSYAPAWVFSHYQRAPNSPLLFDGTSARVIDQSAEFLRSLTSLPALPTDWRLGGDHYRRVEKSWSASGSRTDRRLRPQDWRGVLRQLGVVAKPVSAGGWLSADQARSEERGAFELPSDAYAGPGCGVRNPGSSRHAMLPGLQLKGCGRNRLALRDDFAHRNGTLDLQAAVAEYVRSHLYSALLPLGCARVFFVSAYRDGQGKRRLNGYPLALLGREPPGLRLAHLPENGRLAAADRKWVRRDLRRRWGTLDEREVTQALARQWGSQIYFGIAQLNPIPDNLTLSGQLIDLASVYSAPHGQRFGGVAILERRPGERRPDLRPGARRVYGDSGTSILTASVQGVAAAAKTHLKLELDPSQLRRATLVEARRLARAEGLVRAPAGLERLRSLDWSSRLREFPERRWKPVLHLGRPAWLITWGVPVEQAARKEGARASLIARFNSRPKPSESEIIRGGMVLTEASLPWLRLSARVNERINSSKRLHPCAEVVGLGTLARRIRGILPGRGAEIAEIRLEIAWSDPRNGFRQRLVSLPASFLRHPRPIAELPGEFVAVQLAYRESGGSSGWQVPIFEPMPVCTD